MEKNMAPLKLSTHGLPCRNPCHQILSIHVLTSGTRENMGQALGIQVFMKDKKSNFGKRIGMTPFKCPCGAYVDAMCTLFQDI